MAIQHILRKLYKTLYIKYPYFETTLFKEMFRRRKQVLRKQALGKQVFKKQVLLKQVLR